MSDDWTDRIVGARMELDREFEDRVAASRFSSQQWGLIMTAVEFDVENPDDPGSARLIADTGKLPSIAPELDSIDQMAGMGGGPQRGGRTGGGGGGGLLNAVKDALGLGGGGSSTDDEQLAAAEELTQAYADELQSKLEQRGRWDEVRETARE